MALRILSILAIVTNIVSMGVWFALKPPVTYERMAEKDIRNAHATYRKTSAEKSYAMYRKVVDNYPRSTFADEGRYFAGRTAFLGMGKFVEAEQDLTAFLDSKSTNDENRKEAQEYLDLIRNRVDLPAELRDEILWEYVQAIVEEGNGQLANSVSRLEWIAETYKTTTLGQTAEKARERVTKKMFDLEMGRNKG